MPRGDVTFSGREKRKRAQAESEVEPVLLTKKLAEVINGVVLAGHEVGDRLCLARDEAKLLIAEGWACPAPPELRRSLRSG